MVNKKQISIVIPVYNEQENIPLLYKTLCDILQKLEKEYVFELIFVDDGSKDNSWQFLEKLAENDERIKAFSFSRNFGHQIALQAGYDNATGDAVISMDADMQDPPKLIIDMLQQWENGSSVVYARRIDRRDGFLKKVTANLYYRLLSSVSSVAIPRNVGDFRLIDKKVLQFLNSCPEKFRYLRGLVSWGGFAHSYVDFQRPNRHAGQTAYTWKKMFGLAFDGMTSFSSFPLKISAYVGFISLFFAMILFLYLLGATIFTSTSFGLGVWLAAFLFMLVSGQFLALWLLGEYVARIAEQQKSRPLYLIERRSSKDSVVYKNITDNSREIQL